MTQLGNTEAPGGVQEQAATSATVLEPESPIAGRTPWELAKMRLKRDKVTIFFLFVVFFTLLLAVLAPFMVKFGIIDPYSTHSDLIDVNKGSIAKGPYGGMSWDHPLGVEPGLGRDVLSRLIFGVTFSIVVAFSSALIATVLGTVAGIIAGFSRGRTDFWLSRLMDLVLTFPTTLMLIALSGMFIDLLVQIGVPKGNTANGLYIILVLGFFGWPGFARIIRGQVLSLREREFIESAQSIGAGRGRIYFKELLPNLWAPILVYFTLLMPTFVSAEAALSFLGVGIKPPTPTLGNILTDSVNYSTAQATFFFFPAIIIAVVVLSFNLVGDGLRDALDPKGNR